MLTLIKLDTAVAYKAEKLGVGDVIATHNGTQHLRRIDALEIDGNDVHLFVSKPKAGGDEAILTFPKGTLVNVMGRVEESAAPKVKATPKPRGGELPAPVKVTKTAKVAPKVQPIHAKADKVETITRRTAKPTTAAAAPESSLRSAIRTELRSAIEVMVLAEIKAVIADVLA